MKIKQQSTGHNDSVEDAVIAICNIKTEDGKLINMQAQFDAVVEAFENIPKKPLSDEEINALANQIGISSADLSDWEHSTGQELILEFARAIEDKLLGGSNE